MKKFIGYRLEPHEAKNIGDKISSRVGDILSRSIGINKIYWNGKHKITIFLGDRIDYHIIYPLSAKILEIMKKHFRIKKCDLHIGSINRNGDPQFHYEIPLPDISKPIQKPDITFRNSSGDIVAQLDLEDMEEEMEEYETPRPIRSNVIGRCFGCRGAFNMKDAYHVVLCQCCADGILDPKKKEK